MKKNTTVLTTVLLLLLVGIITLLVVSTRPDWQYRYYEDLKGATYKVVANEVNLREGPGEKADIVGVLKEGAIVKTTGRTYELEQPRADDDTLFDYWVELDDGNWVVNWALTGGRIG